MFGSTNHPKRRRSVGVAVLATIATIALLFGPAVATSAQPGSDSHSRERAAKRTVSIPISFQVENVNRSKVECASDGNTYTVRGHIVGPSKDLRKDTVESTTLYLHGLSFGEFFWNFQQAEGYDYAEDQALEGHVSVIIDRLGYVSSDKPNGNQICVGSRADMAHQRVRALRSGDYQVTPDGTAPRFENVVLAGHSYGSQIAQVEAYSFGDIDGLIVVSYADRIQSELLMESAAYATQICADGGLRVGAVGPAGYAPFGPPEGAPTALFNSAIPPVENAALQLLTIDPCGDVASFPKAVEVDLANVASITVPVLVVTGGSDALFPPPAGPDQASLFTGSDSVSQTTLPDTAHAVTLEATHELFVSTIDEWLDDQKFDKVKHDKPPKHERPSKSDEPSKPPRS